MKGWVFFVLVVALLLLVNVHTYRTTRVDARALGQRQTETRSGRSSDRRKRSINAPRRSIAPPRRWR